MSDGIGEGVERDDVGRSRRAFSLPQSGLRSLSFRIALTLVLPASMAVALFGILVAFKLYDYYDQAVQERHAYLLREAARSVQGRLNSGIALSEIGDSSALSGVSVSSRMGSRMGDVDVEGDVDGEGGGEAIIAIFDDRARVVLSNDPSEVGEIVPEEWVLAWESSRADAPPVRLGTYDDRILLMPLIDNLGRRVGAATLGYSFLSLRARIEETVIASLAVYFALLIGALTFGGLLATMRLFAPLESRIRSLSTALSDFAAHASPSAAGSGSESGAAVSGSSSAFDLAASRMVEDLVAADSAMDAARAEVIAIDEEQLSLSPSRSGSDGDDDGERGS